MVKYVKVSWWSAAWLLGMVAFGVYAALRNDWLGAGIDFGAALILWPLSAASQRDREKEQANLREWQQAFSTLADGGEVTLRKVDPPTMAELPPPPDWAIQGYEPIETPEHTDPGFGNPDYVPPGD